jgi:acylphosphatase
VKSACRVHYEGRVQGVGFRATVRWIVEGFEVTGWVRNLPDGRVELWAQGEKREVEDFLLAIRQSELAGHIQSVVEERAEVEVGQKGFRIAVA